MYIKPANQAHGASYIDETKLIGGERLESRVAVPAAGRHANTQLFLIAPGNGDRVRGFRGRIKMRLGVKLKRANPARGPPRARPDNVIFNK